MNTQRLRTFSRVLLIVLMVVHIVSWYVLEIQVAGSIGIEAFFAGLSRGVINAGVIFWVLVFVSAILLGRGFCGWFCWFGGYIELTEWGINDKLKLKIPHRLPLYLGAIPFVSLSLKIYSALLVNWIRDFPATFIFHLADVEPWGGQQTGVSILITLIMYAPVLFFVFGSRAWCRYLCPIGALLKIFSVVSLGKVRLTGDECIGCETCNLSCDMQVDVLSELGAYGEVRDLNCIRCLECIDVCPSGAISFTFSQGMGVFSSDVAGRVEQASHKLRKVSGFDVAVTALWIGVTVVMYFGGARQYAPQEVKVLMGPGLLILVYGLVWTVYRASNRLERAHA